MSLDFLSIFDSEHEAFIASCERVPVAAKVPSCPEWSVGDLLYHLYEVQYLWHRVSAEARSGFDGLSMPVRPADGSLVDVLRGEHVSYTSWLRANDPSSPQWTWTGMRDFQWLARRMAHELAMHRVDADLARGQATAIEPALASDGIDEFLEFFRNGDTRRLRCTSIAPTSPASGRSIAMARFGANMPRATAPFVGQRATSCLRCGGARRSTPAMWWAMRRSPPSSSLRADSTEPQRYSALFGEADG